MRSDSAAAREPGDEMDQLLAQAAAALRRVKEDGPYTPGDAGNGRGFASQRLQTIDTDLRRALERDEFELHYQPLVWLRSQEIVGFEALIRWRHPGRGLVTPDAFIADAEKSGLIVPIGAWGMLTACRTAASWPGNMRVAVNVSPSQLKSEDFTDGVFKALAATGLAPNRLELEITESIFIADHEKVIEKFQILRRQGVRISLDDFGSGYSSLGYLKRFTFDKIKTDRSFIHDLGRREEAMAIVRAIASLSAGLGVSFLAEGVETAQQAALLRHAGCTEAQGYHFGRPQPSRSLDALLRRGAEPQASDRVLTSAP